MSKVVSLNGQTPRGEPDPEVIKTCEAMYEKAKRGEIHGISACYENANGEITTVMQLNGNLFAMGQAISALWFRFQQWMQEE